MTDRLTDLHRTLGNEPLGTLKCKTCGAMFPDSEHYDYPHDECWKCKAMALPFSMEDIEAMLAVDDD